MLGEWYLPPGECQVILPIKKVPFPFPTTLSSPFRQGSLKPRFCKQIARTPRNPPGPRIRRSEGALSPPHRGKSRAEHRAHQCQSQRQPPQREPAGPDHGPWPDQYQAAQKPGHESAEVGRLIDDRHRRANRVLKTTKLRALDRKGLSTVV